MKWENVNEKVPDDNSYVLIFTHRCFWDFAEFKNGKFVIWANDLSKPVGINDYATHWCELEIPE